MMEHLTKMNNYRSFSISPENLTGGQGEGGKATEGTSEVQARELGQGWKVNPCMNVKAGETLVMADVQGQGAIKHIWITCAEPGRTMVLRIFFDGKKKPAVEVPLSDFFCNANAKEFRQISSLAICVNPNRGYNCYFEMPYFTGFRMELENLNDRDEDVFYQIDCEEKILAKESLYFHAQFRRLNPVPYKQPYVILDNIRGRGKYVGTYLHWGVKSNGWWGEGEIKFYIDGDDAFPTICGTGTEDYFCGAFNFDVGGKYREYCTPYSGLSKVGHTDETYRSQRSFDLYRWHITDPIYFHKDLKITIQALGWRSKDRYMPLQDDISSVAYWYSDSLEDEYPELPDANGLEIV